MFRVMCTMITIIVVALSVSSTQADIPQVINYQGRLTDSTGTPVDTTVDFTFTIYSDSVAGTSLWTETHTSVTVQKGLFSVLLGSMTPLSNTVFDGSVRWLGIQAGSSPESTSRLPLVSSTYAYRAGYADTAAYALSAPGGGGNGWIDNGNYIRLETSADSVGIGVVVPSAKLDVNGDTKIKGRISVGTSHTNTGTNSSIGGGSLNTASGDWSVIGGGNSNDATQTYTTVSGGAVNRASGTGATVSGGTNNKADGSEATVGGGKFNRASGNFSVIAGGGGLADIDSNRVDGGWSAIGGGHGNTITGYHSTIAGGQEHSISGYYSAILGGYADTITSMANYSYLFGIGSKLTSDSTFMVDMPHIRFGDESSGYEFPTQDGSTGQVMATNGSGQLGWTDAPGISQAEADNRYVNKSGDEMNGDLTFDNNDDGTIEAKIDLYNDYANMNFYDGDSLTTKIFGHIYGGVYLFSDTGGLRIQSDASPGGGLIKLYDNNTTEKIILNAGGVSANYTVMLPDSAIDNDEILNEPGIVSAINTASYGLGGSMTDMVVQSITIPTAGYIHVTGRCYIRFSGTRDENGAYIQIDETSGGSIVTGEYVRISVDSSLSIGSYRFPVFVDRIFYKPTAGTYTFRLEGMKYAANGMATTFNHRLTAVFYPTSYGSVSTVVAELSGNPEAVPVAGNADEDTPGTEQAYQVDLRYYELKAKEARMKALEAELELEKARQREENREMR